jgi:NAD(P)-dependent dehydrogenase (short-subunit alcohol dehydrogenase family)
MSESEAPGDTAFSAHPEPRSRRPLAGQVIIVTGAGSGIGRACAVGCVGAGAKTILVDNDGRAVESLGKGLAKDGYPAVSLVADVSCEPDVSEIVRVTHQNFGPVTGLVNAAAIRYVGTVDEHTKAWFEQTLAVNLTGPFMLSREIYPDMIQAGRGSIVNISSVVATTARRDAVAYCAAKGGLESLTRALAADLGSFGIRVNTVIPSFVETAMTASRIADAEAAARMRDAHVLGGWAQPSEISACVVFLLSDEASFITGAAVPVDGGWLSYRRL